MPENVVRLFAFASLIIGAIGCFAGYKILNVMIICWEFFIGAILGVLLGFAVDSVMLGVVLVLVLVIALAVISCKMREAGIFVMNAFLTGTFLYIIIGSGIAAVIFEVLFAVIIGMLAIYYVKPVTIMTTSFAGSGIILASAYLVANSNMDLVKFTGLSWYAALLWVPISLAGIYVQFLTTSKIKGKKASIEINEKHKEPISSVERKYPGMQIAYRNFCIKCGKKMYGSSGYCKECGYNHDI